MKKKDPGLGLADDDDRDASRFGLHSKTYQVGGVQE